MCLVIITWSLFFVVTALCYLSDSVDYSSSSYLSSFANVGVFPCILSADGETFYFTRGRGVWV
jgi:hypothetical protein